MKPEEKAAEKLSPKAKRRATRLIRGVLKIAEEEAIAEDYSTWKEPMRMIYKKVAQK